MLPISVPMTAAWQPLAAGLVWLAAVGVLAAAAVVGLVARAAVRTPSARATVVPLRRRLPEAA